MEQNGRIVYLDILKIIAIVGVLVIHSTSTAFVTYEVFSPNYFYSVFISCIFRLSVPVFVMCSGVVFLGSKKEFSIKSIYTRYIPRIVAALALFSVFYAAMVVVEAYTYTGVFDALLIKEGINNLLTFNTHFHLYYLYIIIILYALVPLLKAFLRSASQKEEFYLLLFLFTTANFLPMLRMFYPFNQYFGGMTLQYSLNLVYGMLSYFFLGYYLNKHDIGRKKEIAIYVLGALGAVITFCAVAESRISNGVTNENFLNAMNVNVYFMAAALFLAIKRASAKVTGEKPVRALAFVSKSTFTIYLVHQFYNMVFARVGLTLTAASPFIMLPVLIVLNFALSFATYLIFRKIPVLKKII